VAGLHGKLAAQLSSMPTPKGRSAAGLSPSGRTPQEIRADFRDSLAQVSEPERLRAKAAYRACVAASVRYQYVDEHARACGEWLSRHFQAEYPRIDEIADRPSHRYSVVDTSSPLGGVGIEP
jgi:hypothetical protein